MTASYRTLVELDAELAKAGHFPLTPWWRTTLERFYEHPTAKTLVGRVGRGGAKSHTSGKVGLNECLFGDWRIPPGERHYWAYVSKSKDEAGQRLLLIESFLRALNVSFDRSGDEIALRDMPRGFRVFACQIGAVSGFRCFGYSEDELAKWQNSDHNANPAAEVSASLNAMCVTHAAAARRLLISSPFGLIDYHAQRFDTGDTDEQLIAHAPSWVANQDGISEADTHKAELDERVWRREYLAVPSETIEDNWFGTATDAAIEAEPMPPVAPGVRVTYAVDPSFDAATPDRFGFAALTSEPVKDDKGHRRITRVRRTEAWRPDRSPLEMARLVRKTIDEIEPHLASREFVHVVTDQHEGSSWAELARAAGLSVSVTPWTGSGDDSKLARFRSVRTAMFEGTFRLPNDPDLIRELRVVRGAISKTGAERIELPRDARGHCDRVAAVILGGSIALARSPTPADRPPSPRDEQQEMRADAIRAIENKRRKEWQRSPRAVMRKALGLR